MRMRASAGLAAIASLFVLTAPAHAAPILFCNSGPGIDLVANGCISGSSSKYANGGDGIYTNGGGGDSESAVERAIKDATGATVDLTLYGKSDDDAGLFSFSSALSSKPKTGSWDVLDNSVLIKYITVKAANSFALYEMSGNGVNFGSFTTLGILNNGGQQPGVSHISFWTVPAGAVPEPASWALMIAGMGAIGFSMRRRPAMRQVSFS